MVDTEIHDNWNIFLALIKKDLTTNQLDQPFIKRYIEQNKQILNEVLALSIENLQTLGRLKNNNDILCLQAKFANDLSKKIALTNQRFLNHALGDETDYNTWLKSHCDLATD